MASCQFLTRNQFYLNNPTEFSGRGRKGFMTTRSYDETFMKDSLNDECRPLEGLYSLDGGNPPSNKHNNPDR